MSWEDKLRDWQSRPEATRRRLALGSSLVLTLLIAGLWSINLHFTLAPAPAAKTQTAGLWQISKERIIKGWQILKNHN